jgi:DNA-directed RNA polymerase subunit RPC12/RpoP
MPEEAARHRPLSREPMKPSTQSGPWEPAQPKGFWRPSPIQVKTRTSYRCRLCNETIEVLSDFRASSMTCPRCGVTFTFDPQSEPLPVRGLRLRFAEVLDVQRNRRRADRPAPTPFRPAEPRRRSYLGLIASTALAAMIAILTWGGLTHHITIR